MTRRSWIRSTVGRGAVGQFAIVWLGMFVLGACTLGSARPTEGQLGGTVTVLATWGGDEQASFMAMVKPLEERTGMRVLYEGTRDLNAILTTRLQGGNPPDVAGLPGPGQMAELAREGRLVDLAPMLDLNAMRAQYGEDWLKLGQVDGKTVGVVVKAALKGLVWYNAAAFTRAGYQAPRSWEDLMALSSRIADQGTTPWCVGIESGAASGWPATDWIENILLRQAGPDVYDRWGRGEIAWTAPEVHAAWVTWGQIVTDERMVFGGRQAVLATTFGEAGNPMFLDPPRCYLHLQGSFMSDFFVKGNPGLKPGQDFAFFPLPPINPSTTDAIEVGGDLFGVFKDTPQARALIQHLASAEAQAIWVKRGGALSPNRGVAASDYPDDLSRQMAQTMTGARIVRFDASDLMPEAMNSAFWRATLDYVNNPSNLDTILSGLDRVRTEAYARQRPDQAAPSPSDASR